MKGSLLIPVIINVVEVYVKYFFHCIGPFEKCAFLPPSIDLNGTAVMSLKGT